jgi:hypothetical protein
MSAAPPAWFLLGHREYNDAVAVGWSLILVPVIIGAVVGGIVVYDAIIDLSIGARDYARCTSQRHLDGNA